MRRSRVALVFAAVAVIATAPFVAAGVVGLIQNSTNPAVLTTEDSASSAHDGHHAPGPDGSGGAPTTSPMPQETDSPVDVAEPDGPGSLLAAADSAPRRSARELGAPRGSISPQDVLNSATSVGGCLVDYGDTGQCVPAVPPSQAAHVSEMVAAGEDINSMPHPWSCDELIRYFPDGVKVRQTDPQGLDPDGDGMACTAADRALLAGGSAPAATAQSTAPGASPTASASPDATASASPSAAPLASPSATPTVTASPTPEGASQ